MTLQPIIRVDELLDRVEQDYEFAGQLIDAFVGSVPGWLNGLQDGFAQEDATTVMRHAHAVKGAAASVSAHQAAQAAAQVESSSRQGRLLGDEIEALLRQLQRVQGALAGIHEELNRASSG